MLKAKVLIGVIVAMAAVAHAQTPFPAGMTVMSLSGSFVQPIHFSDGNIYGVSGTWGKFLWDNNSLSLDVMGNFAEQPYNTDDAWFGSIGLLGRWHFLNVDRWSVFFDGGGGFVYAEQEFPASERFDYRGTHFNFYGKVGFGAAYQLKGHEYLTGGVRYYHVSNGQIHGKDQNPGYDGLQYWVGMMWTR